MNEYEARRVVTEEIVPRLPKSVSLSSVQQQDWVKMLARWPVADAVAAIQELGVNGDPIKLPAVRAIILRRTTRTQRTTELAESEIFTYLKCLEPPEDHPEWEDQLWVALCPAAYRNDRDKIHEWLSKTSEQYALENGGRWCGILSVGKSMLEPDGLEGPQAAKAARERILGGPMCEAKRELLALLAMGKGDAPRAMRPLFDDRPKPEETAPETDDDEPLPDWMQERIPAKYRPAKDDEVRGDDGLLF